MREFNIGFFFLTTDASSREVGVPKSPAHQIQNRNIKIPENKREVRNESFLAVCCIGDKAIPFLFSTRKKICNKVINPPYPMVLRVLKIEKLYTVVCHLMKEPHLKNEPGPRNGPRGILELRGKV
ncbi:hypothetical protein CEXT_537081 [Caerostris extrusa]|uniref:Uncharacterized protein n=1 Tax=Caerostris extrusa TaxID=172846 RepID=A0AAV4N0M3_CAEEX|nr:hypothetical protein CEXT_537081 [Caerostris extrusa]